VLVTGQRFRNELIGKNRAKDVGRPAIDAIDVGRVDLDQARAASLFLKGEDGNVYQVVVNGSGDGLVLRRT